MKQSGCLGTMTSLDVGGDRAGALVLLTSLAVAETKLVPWYYDFSGCG